MKGQDPNVLPMHITVPVIYTLDFNSHARLLDDPNDGSPFFEDERPSVIDDDLSGTGLVGKMAYIIQGQFKSFCGRIVKRC